MYVDQASIDAATQRVVDMFPFAGYFDPHLNGQIVVAETVARYLPIGSKVLDFGAGPADKTAFVASIGYDCTAVDDLSDEWHQRGGAKQRILDFAKDMNINYVVLDAEGEGNQPLKLSGQFDMVMAHDVLEHLHDSPRHLLIDLLEHVRPQGYLFITVPNHVNLRKRLAVLRGRTSLPSFQSYYWNAGRGKWRGHIREYTRGDCIELAQALNLEIMEVRGIHNMLEKVPNRMRKLYLALSRLAPSTRDSWLLVARKPAQWTPRRELDDDDLRKITGVTFWSDFAKDKQSRP